MRNAVVVSAAVAGSLLAGAAFAQKVEYHGLLLDADQARAATLTSDEMAGAVHGEEAVPPGRWGTVHTNYVQVGAADVAWRPGASDYQISYDIPNGQEVTVRSTAATTAVAFPIHLPAGSLIEAMTLNYYDTTTSHDPSAGLYRRCDLDSPTLVAPMSPSPYNGGAWSTYFNVSNHTVVPTCNYYVAAILHREGASQDERVISIRAHYRLQVAPAPASATFSDVPTTSPYFKFVEALVASHVTGGCGANTFCPDAPVTRGQMAVFLATALGMNPPLN